MKILVAIPAYNEERSLSRVIDAVTRHVADILVVDDGSTDSTPTLLARRSDVYTLTHPENRGYGQSLIDAFRFADRQGYDWVITIDCDQQHEPDQLPDFLEEIARNRADVISGSRYMQADPDDDPPPPERRQINHTITTMLAQILGLQLTDSFCGFKAHHIAAMSRLALDEPGYAFPLQFWVRCARAGLRIREIPVRRIYHDHSREFGGTLDDPAARLQHYLEVFVRDLCLESGLAVGNEALGECRCPQLR